MQSKHPLEQGLQIANDKKHVSMQILQSPVTQFNQFKGQQYPSVKTCNESQLVQLSPEVQYKHPLEQGLQNPNDK